MNRGSTTAPSAIWAKLGSSRMPISFGLGPGFWAIGASDPLRRQVDAFDQVRLSHRRSVWSSYRACLKETRTMIQQKSLHWEQTAPERSMTLPARYFYDPKVFEAERERVFYPAWHCVAHVSELAAPGQ